MVKDTLENDKGYIMSSIDEYFEILDKESQKRSRMVAKSLTKYLKNIHNGSKYDNLKSSLG